VVSIDPVAHSATTDTGETYAADYLVLAAGSQPNFFGTPGAEHAFPLYSLDDANQLSTRIVQAFEEADRDPRLADDGAVDFVIVGGGPTGVEVAGALSEMINTTMVHEFPALAPRAKVRLVDHGGSLLKMFADKGHGYAARVLEKDGVELLLGSGVTDIGPGHVTLTDGSTIRTRCVIWGGGLKAAPVAATALAAGIRGCGPAREGPRSGLGVGGGRVGGLVLLGNGGLGGRDTGTDAPFFFLLLLGGDTASSSWSALPQGTASWPGGGGRGRRCCPRHWYKLLVRGTIDNSIGGSHLSGLKIR